MTGLIIRKYIPQTLPKVKHKALLQTTFSVTEETQERLIPNPVFFKHWMKNAVKGISIPTTSNYIA